MELGNRGVSIVICCYNSSLRLPQTIKHIAEQKISPEIGWELIIVNNNSIDNTSEVALTEIQKHKILIQRYKFVDELQIGLSHARYKGVAEAKFKYIIFCDDDNWLEQNYMQTAYEILNRNEKIGAVGGQSEAISSIPFPDWWDDYKEGYAVGRQAKLSGDISFRKYLWGSGMAFKKELYLKAFNELPSMLSDRKGNELSSGGDSEICMRFLLMGYQLYYDESLKFKHFIDPKRLTWEYRKKIFEGFNDASVVLSTYAQYLNILNASIINRLIFLIKNVLKFILATFLRKERFYTLSDANMLFFLTGISLGKTSMVAKLIKKSKLNASK